LLDDPRPDLGAARGQGADILRIEAAQALLDPAGQIAEELAEGVGRGGEAARDADAGRRQAADHLAERGILSADLGQVREAEIFKPRYAHSFGILAS
jgi:hypothetical protein